MTHDNVIITQLNFSSLPLAHYIHWEKVSLDPDENSDWPHGFSAHSGP